MLIIISPEFAKSGHIYDESYDGAKGIIDSRKDILPWKIRIPRQTIQEVDILKKEVPS